MKALFSIYFLNVVFLLHSSQIMLLFNPIMLWSLMLDNNDNTSDREKDRKSLYVLTLLLQQLRAAQLF